MDVIFYSRPSGPDPELVWEPDYTAPWRDPAVMAALPEGVWDGPVVRLARVEHQQGQKRARLVLQRAGYLDYVGTNLSARDCVRTDAIGLSYLLHTADGRCILQQRTSHLAIRPGQLGPSVSGTLEPRDCEGARVLSAINACREICEELSVTEDEIRDISLMGLIREPERNGAPELMYRGRITLTAAALLRRPIPEGSLRMVDTMAVSAQPGRAVPLDNLMQLLAREAMAR